MDNWSNERYFEAKDYWTKRLQELRPRNERQEEQDAFYNALEDVLDKEGTLSCE